LAAHDMPVVHETAPLHPGPAPHTARARRRRRPATVEEGGLGGSGLAAAVVGALALAVFALQLPALVRAMALNGDIASMPALVTLLQGAPPGRMVTLSNAPEYESLAILRATLDWPAHRLLWLALPYVLTGGGLALLARTMWVTWGRWAAAMALATLVVTAEGLRMTLFGICAHCFSLLSMILLGAVLVAFARRPPRSPATWLLTGLGLVAVVGPGTPDLLLIATGILPFALAGVALCWLAGGAEHRRLAIFTVSVSAAATGVGLLLAAQMRADDIVPSPAFGVAFATFQQLQANVPLMLQGFADLAGAHTFGQPVDARSLLGFLRGAPAIVGFLAACWIACTRLRDHAEHRVAARAQPPERVAFVLFWGAVLLLDATVLLVSDLPHDGATGRYLIPAFYAGAVLLPALACGSAQARAYVAIGVLAFSIGVLGRHVVEGPEVFGDGPDAAQAAAVQRFVTSHGATVGYAGYQDAEVLTWQTRARLQVFPVLAGFGCPLEICPYYVMNVSTWYLPRPGVRSFVVTHPTLTEAHLHALPRFAGRPIAQARFGSASVFVYDHDVARDLGAPPGPKVETVVSPVAG
jgi:hypothetical protein